MRRSRFNSNDREGTVKKRKESRFRLDFDGMHVESRSKRERR